MLTVNLFDDTFRHDVCSVAGKTPRHVRYVRDQMEWDGVTLFVDGYINRKDIVDGVRCPRKIGWLHEPPCLHPQDYEDNPVDRFDFILTYHAPLLMSSNKYRFAPYGGIWLPHTEWGLRPKTQLCSFLIGTKMATEGHRLRQTVADELESLGLVDFYGARGTSTAYGWQAKKTVLADYAFSIIVETCKADNEFTEILLDALAVGTVPIFWGADNISNFFNERGMLIFNRSDEVADIIKALDFNVYRSMLPSVAANLRAAYEYEITEDWIYRNALKDMP